MTNTQLYTQILTLPESLKAEVEDFVAFLKDRHIKKSTVLKERKFGCAKGLIEIADDFDAPLAFSFEPQINRD